MAKRWTLVALIASLALNLFLIGAAAGVMALGARMSRERPRPALQRAALDLPPSSRRAFLTSVRGQAQSVHAAVMQARDLRRAAWDSLSSASFDAVAVKAMLRQARLMDVDSRGKIEDGVVDFAAALPAPQRATLGVALSHAVPADRRPPPKALVQRP